MQKLSDKQVQERLRQAFKQRIPSGHDIAARAVAKALAGHENDVGWIKANFSKLVEKVQKDAYKEYLEAERDAGSEAIAEVFTPVIGANSKARDAIRLIGGHFHALDGFYLGLTQGRRPRAGKTFEYLIRKLFGRLGYPFTSQPLINGQPDFILPSLEHFERHAADCIVFTVKRTLRERWRQIVTEGTRGLGFYLATIDEGVAHRDLSEMRTTRITLVVPQRIKNDCSDYRRAPNVISFENFFRFHLDPAMDRWRAAGVIKRGKRR